jgi:hypothetical protein
MLAVVLKCILATVSTNSSSAERREARGAFVESLQKTRISGATVLLTVVFAAMTSVFCLR